MKKRVRGLVAAAAVFVVAGMGLAWLWASRPRQIASVTSEFRQPPVVLPEVMVATQAPKSPRRLRRAFGRHQIATGFILFESAEIVVPPESVQVVRMQLPWTEVVRLGLPANPDRFEEPVKADVVFGHDGIARAIRFVR